jgi:signal transduction histidine kinase
MFMDIRHHAMGHDVRDDRSLVPITVSSDITRGTRSEETRTDLNARLIDAQEHERKRLAQEIHDDFSQRFALTLITLRTLSDTTDNPQARSALADVIEEITLLANDLQALSHRLYAPRLKSLGLVPNLTALCKDVSRDRGIEVVCQHTDVPDDLSDKTVLTMFRVAQEALHNVVKHSGASKVEVQLTGTREWIGLTIADNGTGLNPRSLDASNGVGIDSMRERILMLGGVFQIDARPSFDGTRVVATVPATRRERRSG